MKDAGEIQPRPARMNLTPMIDVVFLLIIFFVVSNTMMQRDISMQLDLPAALTGQTDENSQTGKMIINMDASGGLYFGALAVTSDELRAVILQEKANARRPLEIRIRTDRSVPYERIEPLLTLCVECGVSNVAFSVLEKN